MIYHLFELLSDYDIPGQRLMGYLSFRAMLAFVTAMLISFFAAIVVPFTASSTCLLWL